MLQVQAAAKKVREVIVKSGAAALTGCEQGAARRLRQSTAELVRWQQRGLATASEPYDAVIIGGGMCEGLYDCSRY